MEFLAPNKAGDMAQLLIKNQDNYVPVVKVTDEEPPYVAATVSLHGDQLFEERARNTQWTYQLGGSKFDRLEGIETEFADWHAKYNLYMVCLRIKFTSCYKKHSQSKFARKQFMYLYFL